MSWGPDVAARFQSRFSGFIWNYDAGRSATFQLLLLSTTTALQSSCAISLLFRICLSEDANIWLVATPPREHEHGERSKVACRGGQLVDGANQRLSVNAEVPVEIADRSRLSEVLDTVRNGPMPGNAAQP